MKTNTKFRPVDAALEGYAILMRESQGRNSTVFPPEKELAARWNVSQAAVNRAASRLIASGRLRRLGYKLMPAAAERETVSLTGARLAALTNRNARFPGVVEDAARRGVRVEEVFHVGRDTLRHNLRLVAQKRFDGAIFLLTEGGWEWDDETAEFDRLKIPYVVCEEAPAGHNLVADDLRGATASLITHLVSLGHKNIVYLGSLRRAYRSNVVRQAYEETCLRLNLQDSVRAAYELSSSAREVIRATLRQMRAEWRSATAVVLFDGDLIEPFLAAAKLEQIVIPRDLSLVAVGDSPAARSSQPAVTCAGFDFRTLAHVTFDLVCQNMLEVRRTGRLLPRQRIRLEAMIRQRSSVAACGPLHAAGADQTGGDKHLTASWSQLREQRLHQAEASWQQLHRLAAAARPGALVPLNLGRWANRSFARQNGWLGDLPLLHFGAGRKSIHGITFEIIDERSNRGKGAIVLRSRRSLSTAGRVLPLEIAIPIRRRVRAVYFLHGCGYAGAPTPFAWYDFYLADHRPISVPVVARGIGDVPADLPQPNIQDWWPDLPQFNGDGIRHLVITKDGDPFDYERYLYTLEWENPWPDAELTTLYIRSNPAVETTLAVLGITVLAD